MNELHWTELAAHVVAWHNRHPLARQVGVQHVHSLGFVRLPFAADDVVQPGPAPTTAALPASVEPMPPEALSGSLRERAMARAQLQAQESISPADDAPPPPPAPTRVRPAFEEDFMPPFTQKALRRWTARHAVAQATPRADVPVRKVRAEAGLDRSQLLPRWVLTAQIEVGRAKTRVLVGPGASPSVLGRRMISPGRTLALFALAGVLAGITGWVVDRQPVAAVQVASKPVVPLPASAPAQPPGAPAPAASAPPAERPVDVEPRLGQIELPSLGPRIDERRRLAQQAAASSAAAAPPTPTPTPSAAPPAPVPTPPPPAAAPAPSPRFAVATRVLRTRTESEQVASAMRELLASQPGPPVRVEVLATGDDWRVVGWPYADQALADKARALLASRGMKVQVIDF